MEKIIDVVSEIMWKLAC